MTIKLGINLLSRSVQRNINSTTNELGKVTERLSTGLRINRAVDDAAGLSIASSLNADKRVFSQAIRNLNDGASLVNIADGALDALTNITIRIEELAEQSANGTYTNSQRKNISMEYQALLKEFGRIGDSVEFNDLELMLADRNGNSNYINLQTGIGGAVSSNTKIDLIDSGSLSGIITGSGWLVGFPSFTITSEQAYSSSSALRHSLVNSNGDKTDLMLFFAADDTRLQVTIYVNGAQSDGSFTNSPDEWSWISGGSFDHTGGKLTNPILNLTLTDLYGGASAQLNLDLSGFTIQEGPSGENINFIELTGVETVTAARNAMSILSRRHSDLALHVGKIGATQARLQASSSVLTAQNENVLAARSRIIDTDIASDAAANVNLRIKQQVGASLLAQANLTPQISLDLLKN